jgi:hypothetical protein
LEDAKGEALMQINSIILLATVACLAVYLLHNAAAPGQYACSQVGSSNHSGVQPFDPFGFCGGDYGQTRYAGRR